MTTGPCALLKLEHNHEENLYTTEQCVITPLQKTTQHQGRRLFSTVRTLSLVTRAPNM